MEDDRALSEARDLFVRYDGSRFYMSRDGVEQMYLNHRIPVDIESAWLTQLTNEHLVALSQSQNNRALNYLLHYRYTNHLLAVLLAPVAGSSIDRVVYLESLVKYLACCPTTERTKPGVHAALRALIETAASLRHEAPSGGVRARVDSVIARLGTYAV